MDNHRLVNNFDGTTEHGISSMLNGGHRNKKVLFEFKFLDGFPLKILVDFFGVPTKAAVSSGGPDQGYHSQKLE